MGTDNRIQELFPEEFLNLQREIQHHPALCERMNNHPAGEMEIRLAEIASYCDVILDGDYTRADLQKLAGILCKRLMEKRSRIIIAGRA